MFTNPVAALRKSLVSSCAMRWEGTGLLRITGADRLDLLHRLSTNNLLGMNPGDVRPTLFITDKGRMVDFALVLHGPEDLLLVCSPPSRGRLKSWIERFVIMEDVRVSDVGSSRSTFTICGPATASTVAALAGTEIFPDTFRNAPIAGATVLALVYRTADGVHGTLIAEPGESDAVEARVAGLMPLFKGHSAELARIGFGIPAADHELTEAFTPYDIGLRYAINYTKGCYIGQEVIARIDTYQKVRNHLLGVVLTKPAELPTVPMALHVEGEEAGLMTSCVNVGTGAIGLAVVRSRFGAGTRAVGTPPGKAALEALLTALPFQPPELQGLESS